MGRTIDKSTKNISKLVNSGFTTRMAKQWLASCEDEVASGLFEPDELEFAHSNGFLAESVRAWGVSEENQFSFLSDYEYDRLWPLNPWQRIWINDKLTLKLLLSEGRFESSMPAYYYYSQDGGLIDLAGLPSAGADIAETLKEVGEIACKPCNGSLAQGFYRLAFSQRDGFSINGNSVDEDGINEFPTRHPNYVFTEYIHPSERFSRISPLIHTLRIMVCAPVREEPFIFSSYIRFACGADQEANYAISGGAGEYSGLFANVDVSTGAFGNAKMISRVDQVDVRTHPENGASLTGTISEWNQVVDLVLAVSMRLQPLEWMGFDIGLTDNGPKIMEINSHPGLHYVQTYAPLLKNEKVFEFISKKSANIEQMNDFEMDSRSRILR